MSIFACEKCGAICQDSERGYVTGCEHYPPDIKEGRDMSNEQKPLSERVRTGWFRLQCLGEGIGWVTNPEAESDIADEIAVLEQRLAAAEADLSRLNVVADTVCHDPQGIGPSAVMFKQCKRIAELERELAEARKDAERWKHARNDPRVAAAYCQSAMAPGHRVDEAVDADIIKYDAAMRQEEE